MGASDWGCRERERFVERGGGGGGGGIYMCVTDKEREGQQERLKLVKGVQCMRECVYMQLDKKWSVD